MRRRGSLALHRTISILLGACLAALVGRAGSGEVRWEPKRTRVFLVSLTRFKGGEVAPWGNQERLDGNLVSLLKKRGVPEHQILFLADEKAGSENVKKSFNEFLVKSNPGEFLIFYFSSHGEYDAEKGAFAYDTFDGTLPFQWAFDAIESRFRGREVLMFADCCYSGGIVEMAPKRRTDIAYACLSSTYSHNVGFSGWRFFDCVLRGFGGAPVVDLDGDGRIDLEELARFTERHMAFVAEGRPMFTTTNGFERRLVLSEATGQKKDPQIGRYVEALYKDQWEKSEITDLRPGQFKVHHTEQGSTYNDWVPADHVRPFAFQHFEKGVRVEVEGASSGKIYPATVLDSWESLHLCRFDGYTPAYDEWVGPSRLMAVSTSNLSGKWAGEWVNSLGEQGSDSLILGEDAHGTLKGIWSGDVKVSGARTGEDTAQMLGKTSNRSYQFSLSVHNGVLTMKYVAKRLDAGGSYEGTSTMRPAK